MDPRMSPKKRQVSDLHVRTWMYRAKPSNRQNILTVQLQSFQDSERNMYIIRRLDAICKDVRQDDDFTKRKESDNGQLVITWRAEMSNKSSLNPNPCQTLERSSNHYNLKKGRAVTSGIKWRKGIYTELFPYNLKVVAPYNQKVREYLRRLGITMKRQEANLNILF